MQEIEERCHQCQSRIIIDEKGVKRCSLYPDHKIPQTVPDASIEHEDTHAIPPVRPTLNIPAPQDNPVPSQPTQRIYNPSPVRVNPGQLVLPPQNTPQPPFLPSITPQPPLPYTIERPSPPSLPPPSRHKPRQQRSPLGTIFLVIFILLLVAACGVSLFYLMQSQSSLQKQTATLNDDATVISNDQATITSNDNNNNIAVKNAYATQTPLANTVNTATANQGATATALTTGIPQAALVTPSPLVPLQAGKSFSLYITFSNAGQSTWSDVDNYTLTCVSDNQTALVPSGTTSTCLGNQTIKLNGDIVPPEHLHTFIILCTAPTKPGKYVAYWELAHRGIPFGPEVPINITVTA